jgi:hypothetical protein
MAFICHTPPRTSAKANSKGVTQFGSSLVSIKKPGHDLPTAMFLGLRWQSWPG